MFSLLIPKSDNETTRIFWTTSAAANIEHFQLDDVTGNNRCEYDDDTRFRSFMCFCGVSISYLVIDLSGSAIFGKKNKFISAFIFKATLALVSASQKAFDFLLALKN